MAGELGGHAVALPKYREATSPPLGGRRAHVLAGSKRVLGLRTRAAATWPLVFIFLVLGACSAEPEVAREDRDQTPTESELDDGVGEDAASEGSPADDDISGVVGFEDDREVATAAAAVLTAESLGNPADALTPAALDAAGPARLVPEDASVDVELSTWERSGSVAAVVVNVTLTGADSADRFVAWLVETSSGWRLSHTDRLDGA